MVTKSNGFSLRDDLVEKALVSGAHKVILKDYFGELVYDEVSELATRTPRKMDRDAPKVLILPGILGSKLGNYRKIFHDTIWFDPSDIVRGRLADLTINKDFDTIEPLGVLLSVYLKLKLYLRLAGFDVMFHPFDWRKDITVQGSILASRIRKETNISESNNTVYLLAHSMGGLVSRAALKLLHDKDEDEKVTRLIMLGTPNYGSFLPIQVLSGYSSLVRMLAALDQINSEADLVNNILNTFPGLYQMLPAKDRFTEVDIYNFENWPDTGMKPNKSFLQVAPQLHEHLAPNDTRLVLIAGINQETIVGAYLRNKGLVFTFSKKGDGIVPLALAQLDGVKTYFVEEHHALLPNNLLVEKAIIDLLKTGMTRVLQGEWYPSNDGDTWDVPGEQLAQKPFGGRTGKNIRREEIRHLLDHVAAPTTSFPHTHF